MRSTIKVAAASLAVNLLAVSLSLADPDLITTHRGDASDQTTSGQTSPDPGPPPKAAATPGSALYAVTPDALAAARALAVALNIRPGLEMALQSAKDLNEQRFRVSIQRLPAQEQTRLLIAYDEAFSETSRYRVDEQLNGWTQYYAARLTLSELQQLGAFYSGPIGAKMVHDPKSVTANEKQDAGRAMLAHPEMMKLLRVNTSYVMAANQSAPIKRADFQRDLNSRLCADVDKAAAKALSCNAVAQRDP